MGSAVLAHPLDSPCDDNGCHDSEPNIIQLPDDRDEVGQHVHREYAYKCQRRDFKHCVLISGE